jgi:ribosomal protein S18 acetylase RimI-like enzyme
MTVQVEIVNRVDSDLVVAFQRLIPQLSKSNPAPTKEQLESIVASDFSHILLAKVDGVIVGSLTLVIFHIPTGIRAWIEDVVVDADARGKGVGEVLNRFALDEAQRQGARTVDLTSRPAREAANRMYQRIGFKARETNVYRYQISNGE